LPGLQLRMQLRKAVPGMRFGGPDLSVRSVESRARCQPASELCAPARSDGMVSAKLLRQHTNQCIRAISGHEEPSLPLGCATINICCVAQPLPGTLDVLRPLSLIFHVIAGTYRLRAMARNGALLRS
jgi:hypothetical protein